MSHRLNKRHVMGDRSGRSQIAPGTSFSTPKHVTGGFSLVEVILLLSVVAVFAAAAVPRLPAADSQMDAGLRHAAVALNAVQREALVRQHNMIVSLDTALLRFDVHYDSNNNQRPDSGELRRVIELHNGVRFGVGGTPELRRRPPTSFSVHADLKKAAFVFHRDGSASEEGTIYLTSNGTMRSQEKEHTRALHISRASSRVDCFSYATGSWQESCLTEK